MTENPRTPPAPTSGPDAAAPASVAPDQPSLSAPPSAPPAPPPAPSAPPGRRLGRWITAAVLAGVLLVGGVGGFAIGRATAPEVSGPFGGERSGGERMPGGGSGELPEPPADRSGNDSSDPGSAADGSTDDAATGTSATT
jgi:hypothetical protein